MFGHSVNFIIIVNMSVRTDGKLDNLNLNIFKYHASCLIFRVYSVYSLVKFLHYWGKYNLNLSSPKEVKVLCTS